MARELAERLHPRVERLGYLGEFFRCMAHQPKALLSFMQLTDDLKEALPDNLTEVVALTVAAATGNKYERNQHERLALKLKFPREWIRAVLALEPASAKALLEMEQAAQALTLAAIRNQGRACSKELERVVRAAGPEKSVAILLLIGRYLSHAIVVNSLELEPPVPSIFEEEKQ